MSGAWDRDLALDLDNIRDWGAAAIVTLLEFKELKLLRVERLGEEILRRNMLWYHLPIVDGSIPHQRFDDKWNIAGQELRSILRKEEPGLGRTVSRFRTNCVAKLGRLRIVDAKH